MINKIFFIIFFSYISIFSFVYAENSAVFIDINSILNKSKVGQDIIKQLNKENEIIQKKFKESEVKFNTEEKKIFLKKNILSEIEFNKEIEIFKNKIFLYNTKKKKELELLNKKQINSQEKIINILNPILIDYMEKNSISIIFKKESIVVAPKKINVTDEIIKLLNNKLSKLELK